MRSSRSIIVFFIFAAAFDMEGAGLDEAGDLAEPQSSVPPALYSIRFNEEIEFRALNEDLSETCRSLGEVRGCTEFPAESLTCDCERDELGWRMSVVARIDAVIHVDHLEVLMHERRHLLHIDAMLREFLARMTSAVFRTEANCRSVARLLSRPDYVMAMMNELRMRSNEKYRCIHGMRPDVLIAAEEPGRVSVRGTAR